jgi:coenzyme F420 biosynthesis associated uncharacterized protein
VPKGTSLTRFGALDRAGWLDLNVRILRRALDPVLQAGRLPNSLLVELGRAGASRYLANLLAFLGLRVLGQYDPGLLAEGLSDAPSVYLVEPNVESWGTRAGLPAEDLRRWLILHEMTHAWQFAAHPWLRTYLEDGLRTVLGSLKQRSGPVTRLAGLVGVLPEQWRVMGRVQAVMSVVEGYGNLVMNELGSRLIPGHKQLERAYRERSVDASALDVVAWKLTGLELKLQQYRRGESFCRAVYDRYGIEVLNRVWEGPDALPRMNELSDPAAWQRRMAGRMVSPAVLPAPSPP